MELIRLGGAARLAMAEAVWQVGEHEDRAQRLPRLLLSDQPNRGNLS
jgi:hypothetical protein